MEYSSAEKNSGGMLQAHNDAINTLCVASHAINAILLVAARYWQVVADHLCNLIMLFRSCV